MLTWFAEVKSVDDAKYKTPCQTRGRAGRLSITPNRLHNQISGLVFGHHFFPDHDNFVAFAALMHFVKFFQIEIFTI